MSRHHKWAFEILLRSGVRQADGTTARHLTRADRRDDIWQEIVTDEATGEVRFAKIEPLSEHFGHGDARRSSELD